MSGHNILNHIEKICWQCDESHNATEWKNSEWIETFRVGRYCLPNTESTTYSLLNRKAGGRKMTEEQEKKNANSIGLLPRPPVADTTLLTCVLRYICTGGALHWCDHAMQPWSMNTRQWYEQERLRKETHVSVDSDCTCSVEGKDIVHVKCHV